MKSRLAAAALTSFLTGGLLASSGCNDEPAEIEVAISLGHEDGALRVEPAVTQVTVEVRGADGDVIASSTAEPGGSVSLGDYTAEDFVSFEVRGADATGASALRGRSLGFVAGALSGEVLPLFAQRLGGFSRPPGGVPHGHDGGVAAVIAERWLLSTGGTSAVTADGAAADVAAGDFYDLLAWDGASSEPLPRVASSIVARGTNALLVDATGATWFDFDSGARTDAAAPGGASFGEVAGGATVEAPDGVSFLVGATRPAGAGATAAIFRVDADGDITRAALATRRAEAAAAWIDGVGLVVAGGSAEGAGVEVLGADDEVARTLPFPPSAIRGAALVSIGESTALRVGGVDGDVAAPTGVLALGCASDCAVDVFPEEATLPSITGATAFSTPRGALVIGRDPAGATRPFLVPLDRTGFVDVPLKEPRRGAAVTPAPNGTLAVIGGVLPDGHGATRVEMFFPE